MELTGNETIQIKEAVHFIRNAGRKSAKAKEVRKILKRLSDSEISETEAIVEINQTKPWPAHGPINP